MEQAVKFVKGSDDVIEGLAIPFGGPIQGGDLDGERFGPNTDFCLEWFGEVGRPILYHHGLDDALKTSVVGRQIGFEVRDDGIWVQAQLDKSSRYKRAIRDLVENEALGFSSGAMPHLVSKKSSGEITRWPWVELSLTPTPANPAAAVYAVKATDAIEHLEAVDMTVPEPVKAALKALDDYAAAKDSSPSGESFAAHIARFRGAAKSFREDLDALVERSFAVADWRTKKKSQKAGRELSAANRAEITELLNELAVVDKARDRLRSLLARADADAAAAKRIEEVIARNRAELDALGVAMKGSDF